MFESHNKLTTVSYRLLAFNGGAGFIFMGLYLPSLVSEQLLLFLLLVLNAYFAYRIYHKSVSAIKWCLWLYGLQIVGLSTKNWSVGLASGMKVNITLSYEAINITVNLMALVIWVVLLLALFSLSNANKSLLADK